MRGVVGRGLGFIGGMDPTDFSVKWTHPTKIPLLTKYGAIVPNCLQLFFLHFFSLFLVQRIFFLFHFLLLFVKFSFYSLNLSELKLVWCEVNFAGGQLFFPPIFVFFFWVQTILLLFFKFSFFFPSFHFAEWNCFGVR